jgi:6-phosphogluconolactonase
MIVERIDFENRAALATGLSRKTAQVLSKAITKQGRAVLAVSGGTTPKLFFDHLSQAQISWDKVIVTLVDERQVPEGSPRSNARLVRAALLQNHAAKASFIPLYENPGAGNVAPFSACILGMGTDGHTASYFPEGDTLLEAINPHTDKVVINISAPGSGEPRLTFTLPRLTASTFLALHIEGREKRTVLEKALSGDDKMTMPVRAVLQSKAALHVYWCP